MIPKEILKQIRRIQITTSRMVTDVFAGQYHSVFKGKGMEFDEVRAYVPGDDIRSIDWNVTARTGQPFVKKFVEERELTVMLLLDLSGSLAFGTTGGKLKRQLAAELCSVLALAALKNNDKVGFIGFTDEVELFVPPRKGLRHALRIIREALYYTPRRRGTKVAAALEYLNRVSRRKTVTFIVSDFYDSGFTSALAISNKRHDIVAMSITDPREVTLPPMGVIALGDAETGRTVLLDTVDRAVRERYAAQTAARRDERTKMFQSINVATVDIATDVPYARTLFAFFKTRERRGH